jgi:Mrp family chromosome partitioning ATPase
MSAITHLEQADLSVAFESRPRAFESFISAPDLSRLPVVQQIVERLGGSLLELGRRARRIGPVDAGAIVLLAGCQEGAGCSTAALACATAASVEWSTALVDASHSPQFRGQGLTHLLVGAARQGWEEAVSRTATNQEIVHYLDSREALAFFPKSENQGLRTGEFGYSQADLVGWLGNLRQEFGLVFIDAGTWDKCADQWAPWVDAALIMCDPKRTSAADWTNAWDRFEERGTHVLGIVETFV